MENCLGFVEASKHHQCVWNIGERLRPNDIEKLHFICVGLVPEGKFHELKGSSLLKEIAEIGTNEYVIEALIRIDRMDLLPQLTREHEAAKTTYSSLNTTNFDRLRIVLLYIAKNMTDNKGIELLKDIVKPKIDDKRRLQSVSKVLDLFDLLMQNVILNPSRPETVLEVFHIYEAKPWFDKVRSEYVDAADSAAAAAAAAATEETDGSVRKGLRTERRLIQLILGDKEKKIYNAITSDIASYLVSPELNENLNAANVQAKSSSTPESIDKYGAANTQDSSNSDAKCAETTRQENTSNSSDADDKSVDIKSQGKGNESPDVDDKSDDTNSRGDFPLIPDVDNKSDDVNAKRKHLSSSDFDDKDGEIPEQEKRPSTPESDDKSDTNTEGKLSSKTDHGNSSVDASTQGERPETPDSDDRSDKNTEGKFSSKTDLKNENADTKTQENIPSTPDPDVSNDDTGAQEKLPSTRDLTTNNRAEKKTRVVEEHDGISFVNVLAPSEHDNYSEASSAEMVDLEPPIDNDTDKHLNESKQAAQGEYPMNRKPRGCAVIFNLETFCKVPGDSTSIQLENRNGSSKDAEGLEDAFKKLHFIVDRHDDKTIAEIKTTTEEYALRDHSSFDCFVLCILTHGSEGKLYDANGRSFQFELIFKKFHADKCPTLGGKPKLFFLQACQGNRYNTGRNPQSDTVPLQPLSSNDVREVKPNFLEGNSPNEADFLVFFPARLGLPAFRHDNQGSLFIQSLVENLNKYGESHLLLQILTMVIGEVSSIVMKDQYGNCYDQTPKFDTSLSKTVFFRPFGAQ